jgi:hypothetical protein
MIYPEGPSVEVTAGQFYLPFYLWTQLKKLSRYNWHMTSTCYTMKWIFSARKKAHIIIAT